MVSITSPTSLSNLLDGRWCKSRGVKPQGLQPQKVDIYSAVSQGPMLNVILRHPIAYIYPIVSLALYSLIFHFAMLISRPLLRGNITYSTARDEEVNILHRLSYPDQRTQFFASLVNKSNCIQAIVAYHLNLDSSDSCHVDDIENWHHGSFNVCIPVAIDAWKGKQQPGRRVLLRCPLPYRVGEAFRPGNGDE